MIQTYKYAPYLSLKGSQENTLPACTIKLCVHALLAIIQIQPSDEGVTPEAYKSRKIAPKSASGSTYACDSAVEQSRSKREIPWSIMFAYQPGI